LTNFRSETGSKRGKILGQKRCQNFDQNRVKILTNFGSETRSKRCKILGQKRCQNFDQNRVKILTNFRSETVSKFDIVSNIVSNIVRDIILSSNLMSKLIIVELNRVFLLKLFKDAVKILTVCSLGVYAAVKI